MKWPFALVGILTALGEANLDFVTLNVPRGNYITEADATLVQGDLPNPIAGDVAVWSAILMDGKADFLQGVSENAKSSPYCNDGGMQWCNFAYTLPSSFNPTVGTPVGSFPGSRVRTHYKLNTSTQKWDQDLYVDGVLKSSVSTSQGQKGRIFYISIECAAGRCSPAPAHSWENVSIVLNKSDPSFKHGGNWAAGATGGVMSTPDNGKTWNFTMLDIPTISSGF
ncbi:hypothetical protein F5Y13DRAFT_192549 [Hypoxylon sp. FL1857]|nr:hypothetical protein F5Y13DRAFT_192549 [Hypoxylon sp. FL1857]